MLGADEEYRIVEGLHADASKHVIFADIEPVSVNVIEQFYCICHLNVLWMTIN